MPPREIEWLIKNNQAMGWLEVDRLRYQNDVSSIAYDKFEKFITAIELIRNYGTVQHPIDPTLLIDWLLVWDNVLLTTPKADTLQLLSTFTQWDVTALTDLEAH